MTNHPSEQTLEHLLTLGILRRNAASLQEIERRHIVANVNRQKDEGLPAQTLTDFLRDELNANVEEDESDYASDQPPPPDPICRKAREMLAEGYVGQGMDDPENAELYINMAAENPNVSNELPEKGHLFWKSASFHYQKWKVARRLKKERS